MLCLHCGHQDSPLSDACPECGSKSYIRVPPSSQYPTNPTQTRQSTRNNASFGLPSTTDVVLQQQDASPQQADVTGNKVRLRLFSLYPITIDFRFLMLTLGVATFGWWLGHSSASRQFAPPALVVAPGPPVPPPSSNSQEGWPSNTVASSSAASIDPPLYSPPPHLPQSSNAAPFQTTSATSYSMLPLYLVNTHPVSPALRSQIEPLYQEWEQAHSDGAARVDHLISLYAPDAQIYELPGQRITVDELRALAIQVRNTGRYTSVTDKVPTRWAQNASGDEVEILAEQKYGHNDGSYIMGQRHLIWKNLDGKWKITRDDFPPKYTD